MVDQAAPEAVKLPDPNDPRYAAARAKMANLFFAIGREDSRNGYGAMADDLMCGDLMQVPTWIALGMLAEAASLPCKSGEGAGKRYRHVKRGTVYEVIGTAELQAEQLQGDHAALTVYRGEDGKLWARNTAEFQDGRFVALPALTPDATQTREAEVERLRQALEDVCSPLAYLQRMAEAEGNRLNGAAYAIANDINTVQGIARAALNARGGA